LSDLYGEPDPVPSVFLLLRCNAAVAQLIDRASARVLFNRLAADPRTGVSGNLTWGFSWGNLSAFPAPLRHVVRPVRVTGLPICGPLAVAIELSWQHGPDGSYLVRRFTGRFPDAQTAYLAACCLWSSPIGAGAGSAMLLDDQGTVCPISDMANTCGLIDRHLMKALTSTGVEEIRGSATPGPP
jgi:hypothetical protein